MVLACCVTYLACLDPVSGDIYIVSGPRVIQLLLLDPTQVESKKSSQIQWPVPSINAEPVDIFLGEEINQKTLA